MTGAEITERLLDTGCNSSGRIRRKNERTRTSSWNSTKDYYGVPRITERLLCRLLSTVCTYQEGSMLTVSTSCEDISILRFPSSLTANIHRCSRWMATPTSVSLPPATAPSSCTFSTSTSPRRPAMMMMISVIGSFKIVGSFSHATWYTVHHQNDTLLKFNDYSVCRGLQRDG